MSDRYHRAAQDGYLEVLREATKKDCNTKDKDGMTPTLWAAFEGNLDALRLLVGRGGDPEKYDHYGNTGLHLAAARGHMACVTFLVNFGVNVYSRDIDTHIAKELAAMNDCTDILRYLDTVVSQQETEDPKKARRKKDQAEKEHQKLLKNFKKVQEKADRQLLLEANRNEIKTTASEVPSASSVSEDVTVVPGRRGSLVSQSMLSFSNMVGVKPSNTSKKTSSVVGTVFRKAQLQKKMAAAVAEGEAFKVTGMESDGKRTVRSLSGYRRDSEILFVKSNELDNVTEDDRSSDFGGIARPPPLLANSAGAAVASAATTSSASDTADSLNPPQAQRDFSGIFDRPGFGSVAFRRGSLAHTLFAIQNDESDNNTSDEEDADGHSTDAEINVFLAGLGLQQYSGIFARQKIDLDTLMLLNEQNLMEMNIEIGSRKKILRAIDERKKALQEEQPMVDTKL